MFKLRRRWHKLVIATLLLAVGVIVFDRLRAWNNLGSLRLAQQEIARGQLQLAHRRLTALAAKPGTPAGAADYWLAICDALENRPDAALRSFDRLPENYPFDSTGAYLEAKANLTRGSLRAAERRLEQALTRDGPDIDRIRDLLNHVYQIEVRFHDAHALLRDSLPKVPKPIVILRELSNFELDRLPYSGLQAALEKAGQLAPDEDRVWLGKARLAIESGRWSEARTWLDRCRAKRPDAPVLRAEIALARATGQPSEALAAVKELGPANLDAAGQFSLRAWLYRQQGDTPAELATLERWLRLEPSATQAMERLAELAAQAGQSNRVAEFRNQKAEAERSLRSYRTLLWREQPLESPADRYELARRAERAGRPVEARAVYHWILTDDSKNIPARDALTRLDRPDAARDRDLIDLAASWSSATVPPHQPPPPVITTPLTPLSFTDDAQNAGLTFIYDNAETPFHQLPEPFGGGLALLDFDGDGWLDVYCVQGGPFTPDPKTNAPTSSFGDRLFHNRRDGHFEDVTTTSQLSRFPTGHGHGVAVGDIDNDGHPDLFVTRWRSYALYRNKGDGTFEDITARAGLGGDRDWPTSAAFADLDGDGDLDLYVCHYAAWDLQNPQLCRNVSNNAYINCSPLDSPALPDHLFRNDSGRFVDATNEAGIIDHDGRGLGVVAADFDGDRRVDLFVANDSSANFLFHNKGGMRFDEVGHASGVSGNASGAYQAGMGVAAGDIDRDGLIDLTVTNFYGESTTFYRNLSAGNFTDATASVGLGVATRRLLGFGVALFDANNDARLDLTSANGHVNDLRPNYPYEMPAQLLIAGQDGRFTDASDRAGSPWSIPRMARGLAVGDLDNDGRVDVLILSHNAPLAYLRNQTKAGHYVSLSLQGRPSNRDAIGAKVTLTARGVRQVAQRTGGGSFQSASDPRLHFGLDAAEQVDTLEITWPSGTTDHYSRLPANSAYRLIEGQKEPTPLRYPPASTASRSQPRPSP